MFVIASLVFFLCFISSGDSFGSLSEIEKTDLEERLQGFYEWPVKPEAMNRQGVKVDVSSGVPLRLHPELKKESLSFDDPLLKQSQIKSTPKYQSWYCKRVLKKIDPSFPCDNVRTWADFQKPDCVRDLTETWLEKPIYELDSLPVSGKSERPLWSDDYWAVKRGLTSYRYSKSDWFEDYRAAVDSYHQPAEWIDILKTPIEEAKSIMSQWSPSEKYDLSVKDELFSLTQEQKTEGNSFLEEDGDVEGWMGLCHGWAPASIMIPRPERPVEWMGPQKAQVVWYPNDIKAMITLAWANGFWESNFVGRRCEQKKLSNYSNGRISTANCFDNNPATFHLALANLVGIAKSSFVMDKAYDYQVWNQPIVSYEFTYFNPLNREKRSSDWRKVAVKYNKKFKNQDRFQNPLTRGKFLEESEESESHMRSSNQDGHIKKIVGVIASVVYLVETTPPEFGEGPGENLMARETYLYDLEIAESEKGEVVTGGEWHQNNHPDFLFVPKKNTTVRSYWDLPSFVFNSTSSETDEGSLSLARSASTHGGYPLNAVVEALVKSSTLPRSRNK